MDVETAGGVGLDAVGVGEEGADVFDCLECCFAILMLDFALWFEVRAQT